MPRQIDVPGMGIVEFPDGMGDDQIAAAIKRNSSMGKLGKGPGAPEELSVLEKFAASLPDWMAGPSGGVRGSAVGRVAMGAADPGVALVQIAANAIGQGGAVNKGIADTEAQYQAARASAGSEGLDVGRGLGNLAMTLPVGFAGKAATTLGGMALKGAGQGAVAGALNPVTEGDFLTGKAQQVGMGAAGGAVMAPVVGALGRLISPRASVNPDIDLLAREGVRPTIGQTLGGVANTLEQKAMSVPIVGDAIRAARQRAAADLNEAAINRAVAPIGGTVRGAGTDAVAEAGDQLSAAYQRAAGSIRGVNFNTPQFNQELSTLQQMAQGLEPAHLARFDRALNNVVLRRMSPVGGMDGQAFKAVDSELGTLAAKYGKSPMSGEQELADAVKELQRVMRDEVARSSPAFAQATRAADKGWANLVRVEDAAKRAVNTDGVFTPGQLNMAVRSADRSVRGRAVARGDALMQDLSGAGQTVLGNTVPDSGTAGRLAPFLMGATAPASVPLAFAGAAAYAAPIQNALVALVRNRPQAAPEIANALRRYLAGPTALAAGDYSSGGLSR